jgi:hypothetical protein
MYPRLHSSKSRMSPVSLDNQQQVIDQTVRRVCHGEMVPAHDKLVSIFEPHTQIILRWKMSKGVEFGRKGRWEEVERGSSAVIRSSPRRAKISLTWRTVWWPTGEGSGALRGCWLPTAASAERSPGTRKICTRPWHRSQSPVLRNAVPAAFFDSFGLLRLAASH